MRKLFTVGFVLAFILAGVLFGVGAALPGEIRVDRSIEIAAAPEAIHADVGDLATWPEWTTWNAEDRPGLAITFPGGTTGVGAVLAWTIDEDRGRLELTSTEPSRGVSYRMEVGEDARASEGIISFTPRGPRTEVRWIHEGPLEGIVQRWVGLFVVPAMERDFESALATLRERAEGDG